MLMMLVRTPQGLHGVVALEKILRHALIDQFLCVVINVPQHGGVSFGLCKGAVDAGVDDVLAEVAGEVAVNRSGDSAGEATWCG